MDTNQSKLEQFRKKITDFYIEKSEHTLGYTYLIAVDEDGGEWIVSGDAPRV